MRDLPTIHTKRARDLRALAALFRERLGHPPVGRPDLVRQVLELLEVRLAALHLPAPEVGVVGEQSAEVVVGDVEAVERELLGARQGADGSAHAGHATLLAVSYTHLRAHE